MWLNEGFASYVEYLGMDAVEPGMRMMDQFVVDENQDVMQVDALQSSHRISLPVNHPDEISEIFDKISYSKGAAIIRMMEHFLTSGTFRRGLTNYLNDLYEFLQLLLNFGLNLKISLLANTARRPKTTSGGT